MKEGMSPSHCQTLSILPNWITPSMPLYAPSAIRPHTSTMLSWSAQFLKSQLLTTIPYPTSDFTGQTVIVTGSNTGLAFEAANHIVRLGAHKIILGVRTVSKGEAAAQSIVQRCNVPKARVEVWQLDMGDTKSIKTFAKRAEGLERLDAAVLNAGILTNKYATVDGLESHVAVNVVGTMLLACLLLPKLRAAAEQTSLRGRLTIVGSDLMCVQQHYAI